MAVYKTENREMLLCFLEKHSGEPFTVRQIVSEMNYTASESTVYRLLRELEKDGRVQKTIDPANREYVYIFEGESGGRVNMRCKVCGNVYAADSETSRRIIADVAGFRAVVSGNDLRLSWNRIKNAAGYQLQMYKNGKWQVIKNYSSDRYTGAAVKGLKAGKYKFRIRTYITADGKKIYSGFNTITANIS